MINLALIPGSSGGRFPHHAIYLGRVRAARSAYWSGGGGKTKDGRVLYTAQAHGEAGHYDPTKICAEYVGVAYKCINPWKILIVTYREFMLSGLHFAQAHGMPFRGGCSVTPLAHCANTSGRHLG